MPSNSKISTIFLTGASGQLGNALRRKWSQDDYQSKFCVVASHHETLDIADEDACAAAMDQFCPDIVVNCAGYNGPCLSQADREKSWRTNVVGTDNLARICASLGIMLVHISCDSVFGADDSRHAMLGDLNRLSGLGFCVDGIQCEYTEWSPCGPVDYHGATKLAAEHSILKCASEEPDFKYWILRTGSMFEFPWRPTRSYLYRMAAMIRNKTRNIPAPADVLFSLCYSPEMAAATTYMLENRLLKDPSGEAMAVPRGIYHMANPGATSWYNIAQQMAMSIGKGAEQIVPVSIAEYRSKFAGDMPPVGELGRYRVLSTKAYEALGGPEFSPWRDVVDGWCVAFGGASVALV